jgi:hypothetical protein
VTGNPEVMLPGLIPRNALIVSCAIDDEKPTCHYQSDKPGDVSRVATSTLRRGVFSFSMKGGFAIGRYFGRTAIRSISTKAPRTPAGRTTRDQPNKPARTTVQVS